MISNASFRFLLLASIVTGIASAALAVVLFEALPEELQRYLVSIESQGIRGSDAITALALGLALFVAFPVSVIGIWRFRSWGRSLYTIVALATFLALPVIGPIVLGGWEAMFSYISIFLDGVVIALMYSGPISEQFGVSGR